MEGGVPGIREWPSPRGTCTRREILPSVLSSRRRASRLQHVAPSGLPPGSVNSRGDTAVPCGSSRRPRLPLQPRPWITKPSVSGSWAFLPFQRQKPVPPRTWDLRVERSFSPRDSHAFPPLTMPDALLMGLSASDSLQLKSSAGPGPPGCRGPWHPTLTSGSLPLSPGSGTNLRDVERGSPQLHCVRGGGLPLGCWLLRLRTEQTDRRSVSPRHKVHLAPGDSESALGMLAGPAPQTRSPAGGPMECAHRGPSCKEGQRAWEAA